MLKRIKEEFVGDKTQRHRSVQVDCHRIGADVERQNAALRRVGANEHLGQFAKVDREIQIGKFATGVELLMQTGHGIDAVATFIEDSLVCSVAELFRLEHQQAGDDLEVILDPVVHFGQGSGALLDPLMELGLESVERRQKVSDDTVDQRQHRGIPIRHQRMAVGMAQRRVANKPCGSAQYPDEPPADTAGVPGSQDHRPEVEHREREIARDVIEPGDHRHEDYGQRGGGSLRDSIEALERAVNRGERLFPGRGAKANRLDEQVRVTELFCFHLGSLGLSSLSI